MRLRPRLTTAAGAAWIFWRVAQLWRCAWRELQTRFPTHTRALARTRMAKPRLPGSTCALRCAAWYARRTSSARGGYIALAI